MNKSDYEFIARMCEHEIPKDKFVFDRDDTNGLNDMDLFEAHNALDRPKHNESFRWRWR